MEQKYKAIDLYYNQFVRRAGLTAQWLLRDSVADLLLLNSGLRIEHVS